MSRPDTDLSFDPRDPYFALPELAAAWAVQVFTPQNVHVVDPATARESGADGPERRLEAGLAGAGRQRGAAGRVSVSVGVTREGASWRVHADHPEGVKAVKLLLRGEPARALAAQCYSAASVRGAAHPGGRFQWTYPGQEWATPWATSGAGGFTLSVRDGEVRPKRLHVHVPPYAGEPVAELVVAERAARRLPAFTAPEIRLGRVPEEDDVRADLAAHLAFVEHAYGLAPLAQRADAPPWLPDIDLVVTLHGQHWTGYVFNSFAEMEDALRFVAGHIAGERVLVYLPGWEGRYYHVYPDYRPGEALGGEAGWRALLATARDLGFRVMPMFGAHGANLARYADWERAAFRNDTGRYLTLLNAPDWDGDRAGEGDQIFLNPGEPGFGAHLTGELLRTIEDYGVDAVFLDTAGFWFDDPVHDQLAGYRSIIRRIHARHPEVLVAAEGWWDAMLGLFPLAQQWLGVDRDLRHPEVLVPYARTTAHLAEGAPGLGSTGVHEGGFRPRPPRQAIEGHIPSVSVVDDTLERHADELAAACRWAAAVATR